MLEVKDLELVVSDVSLGLLETNAQTLKDFVEKEIASYVPENYIGNVAGAKADRAVLNTAYKTLDTKRLDLEKEFMSPFIAFKGIIGETVKLIKAASGKLDEVVKEEENREKEEKLEKINTYFLGKDFNLVPFEKIYNVKWLNKGCKDKEWKGDIDSKISDIYTNLKSLESFPDDVEIIKTIYLDTLIMGVAVQKAEEFKLHREHLEEESKAREIREQEKRVNDGKKRLAGEIAEDIKADFDEALIETAVEGEVFIDEDPILTVTLRFTTNRSKMYGLKNYMIENDINYVKA